LAVISIQTGFEEEILTLTFIYVFIYANFPTLEPVDTIAVREPVYATEYDKQSVETLFIA